MCGRVSESALTCAGWSRGALRSTAQLNEYPGGGRNETGAHLWWLARDVVGRALSDPPPAAAGLSAPRARAGRGV